MDVGNMKERIEETIKTAKSKWNEALEILGLSSLLDLLKRGDVDIELNGCRFEGPFPNNGGTFVAEIDDISMSNQPKWNDLDVEVSVSKRMKHMIYVKDIINPNTIKLEMKVGGMSVIMEKDGKEEYLYPPSSGVLQFLMKFDERENVPSVLLFRLKFPQLKFEMTHSRFRNVYGYFREIIEYVKTKIGGEVVQFGSKVKEKAKEKADDIAESAMAFIDTSVIPTFRSEDLPTFIVQIILDDGVVTVPVTSILQRVEKGGDDKLFSRMVVHDFQLCFALDKQYRSVGMFLGSVITDRLEPVLAPFNGISPKIQNEKVEVKDKPAVSFVWQYDKTKPKTERVMSINLTLFNVQVKLTDLFGLDVKNPNSPRYSPGLLSPGLGEKGDTKVDKEKDETVEKTVKLIKTVSERKKEEKSDKTKKLLSWVETKYKGMEVMVNVSECDLVAEDHLHKITMSTTSIFAKQAEDTVDTLIDQLNKSKVANEDLKNKNKALEEELAATKAALEASQMRKRGFSFGRKN
ncbi:hypothetical protein EIN_015470 [Entamoeba invadens IP1]|uniref:hypothetical protein n=1 Tax=Entamoeba invadens IP1 TaxID=370355 RepID=UPI0002C3E048|nr:hypothetical protein EIN_015470 [Entamoeba invadens IP1]ELP90388.1 hypothetical protein EIN_015470 [Entamoeba invadens IP1]|eukprot:XP_004257159.1 hypothetical protein EIN_015470 [Entamoeba invadens IP1]